MSVAAAALCVLSGCGTGAAGEAGPAAPEGSLVQALAAVPAGTTAFQFNDQQHALRRWGLGDITGAVVKDRDERLRDFTTRQLRSAVGSNLLAMAAVMDDWGWNGLDVSWEIVPDVEGPPVVISRLRDGVDFRTVADSFAAHDFVRSGSGDDIRFDRAAGKIPAVPVFLSGVTLVPSKHLVIAGPATFRLPAAGSSLADKPEMISLIAGVGQVDYASMATGDKACERAQEILGPRATPEVIDRITSQRGDLRPITARLEVATDDRAGTVVTRYQDDATAAADLSARTKLMQSGSSVVSQSPYSDYFGAAVNQSGNSLRYSLDFKDGSRVMLSMVNQRDQPWAFCS